MATVSSQATEKRFQELAAQWKRETAHLSVLRKIIHHPAYQEVIGMGEAVIPLLLARLKSELDWCWALEAITGENPTKGRVDGDSEEVVQAWMAWGRGLP